MKIEKIITESIRKALIKISVPEIPDIFLERPKGREHGDFSTNVAFSLVKELKETPREIAKRLVRHLRLDPGIIEKVEETRGFINFFLVEELLFENFRLWTHRET